MNRLFSILVLLFIAVTSHAQITAIKIQKKPQHDSIASAPFDSTYNLNRSRLSSLVGQQVQFLPSGSNEKSGSYPGMGLYYGKPYGVHSHARAIDPDTRYYAGKTRYESLVNKVFNIHAVDSILEDVKSATISRDALFYFKVTPLEGGDTSYLYLPIRHDKVLFGELKEYDDFNLYNSELVVLGYFEKLNKTLAGTHLVVKYPDNKNLDSYILYSLDTGEPYKHLTPNLKLTVTGVGVIDGLRYGGLRYLLTSSETGACYAELQPSLFKDYTAFTKDQQKQKEWERQMLQKYGKANGSLIIDGKVKLGFSKKMCEEAWGKPSSINTTTGAWGVHEQWVYGLGSYLYFENGTLTSIDN